MNGDEIYVSVPKFSDGYIASTKTAKRFNGTWNFSHFAQVPIYGPFTSLSGNQMFSLAVLLLAYSILICGEEQVEEWKRNNEDLGKT